MTTNYLRFRNAMGGKATYEHFVSFFLGLHCGEITLQRFHRLGKYSRGRERIMNLREFILTLQEAFGGLRFQVIESDLRQLFDDLDRKRVGYITYE